MGVEAAGDVEERLLKGVRRVDAGREPGVDARLHHASEPVAARVEELRQGPAVTAAKPADRVLRVAGGLVQVDSHARYTRAGLNRD